MIEISRLRLFICIITLLFSPICQTVTAAPGDNLLETALYITSFLDDGSRRFRYLEHLAVIRAKVGDLKGAVEVMERPELQAMSYCPELGVIEQLVETGYLAKAGSLLDEYEISAATIETCLPTRVPDRERALAVALAYIDRLDRSLDILKSFEYPIEQAIGFAQVANVVKQKDQDSEAEELFRLAFKNLSSARRYMLEDKLNTLVNAFARGGEIDAALEIINSHTLDEEGKAPYLAIIVASASDNGDLETAAEFFERLQENVEHSPDGRSPLLAAMVAGQILEDRTAKHADEHTGEQADEKAEFEAIYKKILPTIHQEAKLLRRSEVVSELARADDSRWADTLVKRIVEDVLSLQEPSFWEKIKSALFRKNPPRRRSFLLSHIMKNLAEAGYGDEACLLFNMLTKLLHRDEQAQPAESTIARYKQAQLTETLVEGLLVGGDPENAFLIATSQSLHDEHLWGRIAARLAGKHEFEKALNIIRTLEDWQDTTNACAFMAIEALSLILDEQQNRQFAQQLFEAYREKTLIYAPNDSLYEVACSLAHIGKNNGWNDEAEDLGKIASILADKTQTALAEKTLERALALVDNRALAHSEIVEALLKMENYERLFQEIRHDPGAEKQLGKLLYPVTLTAVVMGDSVGAHTALDAVMKLVPSLKAGQDKTFTLSRVADFFSQSGHNAEAKSVALTALQNISMIEAASPKSRTLGILAKVLAKSGELNQADELFTQAVETAQNIETFDERTSILREVVEQMAEAERFEQALKLADSMTEGNSKSIALMLIGIKFAHIDDIERALTIAESIKEDQSAKENVLGAISEKLAERHEFDRALDIASLQTELWRKVISLCRIADGLSEQGDFERAMTICERALASLQTKEGSSDFSYSHELHPIALSFAKAGDIERALKLLQRQTHRSGYRREAFLKLALYALSLDLPQEEERRLAQKITAAYNQPTKN